MANRIKKNVLILGAFGMLGSMVYEYFNCKTEYNTRGTARDKKLIKNNILLFDAEYESLEENVFFKFKPDYIINCIGIIKPYCRDNDFKKTLRAIKINSLFPYTLSREAKKVNAKIIQIATDCVYSGQDGEYTENSLHDALDVYGKTKSLGEVLSNNTLHIRCSVIGPERNNRLSLMEWILGHKDGEGLNGFAHHLWNGITTLQFAKICEQVIGNNDFKNLRKISPIHHLIMNKPVNKYELLNIFNDIYNKRLKIKKVENIEPRINRTIATKYTAIQKKKLISIREAILELKNYIEKINFYNI